MENNDKKESPQKPEQSYIIECAILEYVILGFLALVAVVFVGSYIGEFITFWCMMTGLLLDTVIPFFVYVAMKEYLPALAHTNNLFTTVKKGKIKLVKLGGKVQFYVGNLFDVEYIDAKGITRIGKRVSKDTGKIKDGDCWWQKHNFWWRHFGVIWIGFGGSVYEYTFVKLDIGEDGEITKPISEIAHSIFIRQKLTIVVDKARTLDMIPIRMIVQPIIETDHAGLSLNFYNWNELIETQIEAACREFIANNDLRTVTKEKSEEGGKLWKYVMLLNYGSRKNITEDYLLNNTEEKLPDGQKDVKKTKGNIGFPEQFGQKLIGFSVYKQVILDDSVVEAVRAQEVSNEKYLGEKRDAEARALVMEIEAGGTLRAAQKEAEAIKAVGDAKNAVLEQTAKLVTPRGAKELRQTEAMALAVEKHNGTLSLGGGSGIILGDTKEKK